jgi:hypothetical protein
VLCVLFSKSLIGRRFGAGAGDHEKLFSWFPSKTCLCINLELNPVQLSSSRQGGLSKLCNL